MGVLSYSANAQQAIINQNSNQVKSQEKIDAQDMKIATDLKNAFNK